MLTMHTVQRLRKYHLHLNDLKLWYVHSKATVVSLSDSLK